MLQKTLGVSFAFSVANNNCPNLLPTLKFRQAEILRGESENGTHAEKRVSAERVHLAICSQQLYICKSSESIV